MKLTVADCQCESSLAEDMLKFYQFLFEQLKLNHELVIRLATIVIELVMDFQILVF